ncbi:equistatin-like [Argiope bruennichi]|uniref:equistatin-like n=1 Tax=Argiope bruennichi TaxID=94029 RepID=UPI0024943BA2|nr:equistatin-like [Argiope bruennichi]
MQRGVVLLLVVLLISFAFASALSACEEERKKAEGMIGSYKPRCEEDGTYKKMQCWRSIGKCFCVHPVTGERISEYTRATNLKCD